VKVLCIMLMLSMTSCSLVWHSTRDSNGTKLGFADDPTYHANCASAWIPMLADTAAITGISYGAYEIATRDKEAELDGVSMSVLVGSLMLLTTSLAAGFIVYPGCEL